MLTEVIRSGLHVYFAREKLALDPNDPESVERYLNKATQAQAYVQTMKANTSTAKRKLLKKNLLPQGTGVGIYGYSWDKATKKRVILAGEAEIVKEIFTRVAIGQSLISVARDLNGRGVPTKASKEGERKYWHSLTLRRMVKNTSYIGKTYFGVTSRLSKSKLVIHPQDKWKLLENVTPAIISEELFQQANTQLDKPKPRNGCPKVAYLLKNHIFCGTCGKPMVGHLLNRKYRYYQCSNARPYENHGKNCAALLIRANELEDIVWEKTRNVLSNPEIVLNQLADAADTANLDSLEKEIQQLEKNLDNYQQRKSHLLEAMELGDFTKDEILDRLNIIRHLRSEDEMKLNDLRKTRDNITNLANAKVKINELYERVMDNLQNATPEIKSLALDALDIKVIAKSLDILEIQGVIPLELALPTTEQTSALQRAHSFRSRRV